MCLILDANVAHKFTTPPHDDVKPIVHCSSHREKSIRKQNMPSF
jgi:hypothetical protein